MTEAANPSPETTTPESNPSPTTTETTSPATTSTTSETSAELQTTTLLNEDDAPAPVEAPVIPEAYELKAPEGATLLPEVVEAVTPILKELGITNEGAQKLVDFYLTQQRAETDRLVAENNALRKEWRTASENYISTNGKQVKADIGAALNQVFSNEDGTPNTEKLAGFRQYMDMTGAGDNPFFVEAFHKLAKGMIEGKPVNGGKPSPLGQQAPGGGKPSRAAALYPNLVQPQGN